MPTPPPQRPPRPRPPQSEAPRTAPPNNPRVRLTPEAPEPEKRTGARRPRAADTRSSPPRQAPPVLRPTPEEAPRRTRPAAPPRPAILNAPVLRQSTASAPASLAQTLAQAIVMPPPTMTETSPGAIEELLRRTVRLSVAERAALAEDLPRAVQAAVLGTAPQEAKPLVTTRAVLSGSAFLALAAAIAAGSAGMLGAQQIWQFLNTTVATYLALEAADAQLHE